MKPVALIAMIGERHLFATDREAVRALAGSIAVAGYSVMLRRLGNGRTARVSTAQKSMRAGRCRNAALRLVHANRFRLAIFVS